MRKVILKKFTIMLCLYVYNVLPPQRLPGSFEDLLCNGQRKIKETRFKKKKKKGSKKKKRKLRWFGHVSRCSWLAKTILQGTVQGKEKKKR